VQHGVRSAAEYARVHGVVWGCQGALPVLNRRLWTTASGLRWHSDAASTKRRSSRARIISIRTFRRVIRSPSTNNRSRAWGAGIRRAGGPRRVGITRVHLEEDAGKSLHEGFSDSALKTYVDYNRSGVPLIEIVTDPISARPPTLPEFFARLRAILVWLDVNDGNMEEGSLRCDANVSVRPEGSPTLGTKAEVKNLNSFRFLQKALEYEIARQIDVVEDGGRVVQETRLFDSASAVTVSMRSKEEAHDYRYFPEPDLPAVVVSAARVSEIRGAMAELPDARRRRFVEAYALPEYDAGQLTQARALSDYFEATVRAGAPPKPPAIG